MSSAPGEALSYEKPANEWTIMVFFAGDPHLSPSMTSQLKAIKDAGFQANTSVLVHYDPNERGVAVTTFDINNKRKKDLLLTQQKATIIGDGKDPFVRNLLEDAINGATRPNTADQALRTFLDIGAKPEYQAKHYMIFLVGHGVIVGNDMFLPDSNPQSGISLTQLGDTLRHFRASIPEDAVIELVGLHSCAMSAIEVIFELKGVARYMMATEGESFVDSWPYRQLLKKILNTIDYTKSKEAQDSSLTEVDVNCLISSINRLSLHNSTDFMFSGLSADLCLCSLDEANVEALEKPIESLVTALKNAMKPPAGWDLDKDWRGKELIKLAHLEAQSYFQETYTDLYDFCLCLSRRCAHEQPIQEALKADFDVAINALKEACNAVVEALKETTPNSVIVHSDHFGPLFQYSHGLSIFFPWARPVQEEPVVLDDNVLTRYEKYEFTKALGKASWLSFLDAYFTGTQRKSREEEDGKKIEAALASQNGNGNTVGIPANAAIINALKDGPRLGQDSPALKDSARLGTACTCSIKNYPMNFSVSRTVIDDPNPDRPVNETVVDDSNPDRAVKRSGIDDPGTKRPKCVMTPKGTETPLRSRPSVIAKT